MEPVKATLIPYGPVRRKLRVFTSAHIKPNLRSGERDCQVVGRWEMTVRDEDEARELVESFMAPSLEKDLVQLQAELKEKLDATENELCRIRSVKVGT